MTLTKAISRLRSYLKYRKPDPNDNFYEAVQMGEEALKREQHRRKYDIHLPIELLPGETEE